MKEKKKGIEQRLQEAKIQEAEAQRALNVAVAKISHGFIEAVERVRKTSLINSLLLRIFTFLNNSNAFSSSLREIQPTSSVLYPWGDLLRPLIDTYKSIREDIKNSLEIKNFEELFPERTTYFKTLEQAIVVMNQLSEQLSQLMTYLLRFT